MNRREVIKSISTVVGVGSLAGCSMIRPAPEVVDAEVEGGLKSLVGLVDIHVTVLNEGAAGNVRVTVEILAEDGTVLEKQSKTVQMERNERRRITFEVRVPEDAADFRAEAQPTGTF